jgi:hypothetical protein
VLTFGATRAISITDILESCGKREAPANGPAGFMVTAAIDGFEAASRAELDPGQRALVTAFATDGRLLLTGKTGERSIRPADLRVLLDICDVPGPDREALLTLARQAKERGWRQAFTTVMPESFRAYVGLEAEASDDRPQYWVMLNESVIRRTVAGPGSRAASSPHPRTRRAASRYCRSARAPTPPWKDRSASSASPSPSTPMSCTWKRQTRSTATHRSSPT